MKRSPRPTSRSRIPACFCETSFSSLLQKLLPRSATPPGPLPPPNSSPAPPTPASSARIRQLTKRTCHPEGAYCAGAPSAGFARGSWDSLRRGTIYRAPTPREIDQPCLTRPPHHQPVQRHHLRLQHIQFNLRKLAFIDFAPPVDARLGLRLFPPLQPLQKFPRLVRRSSFSQ